MPRFQPGEVAILNGQPVTITYWPDDEEAGCLAYAVYDGEREVRRGNAFIHQVTIKSPAELAAEVEADRAREDRTPVDYAAITQTVDPELAGLLDDIDGDEGRVVDDEEGEE